MKIKILINVNLAEVIAVIVFAIMVFFS